MILKTLDDIDLKGKRVLFRVAYDVPLRRKGIGWIVADDSRIRATIPTLRHLIKKKCRIVIVTYLNRPGGKVVEKDKLNPVAKSLSTIINRPVKKLDTCTGPDVQKALDAMKPSDIVMLENVRFSQGEETNDAAFAATLASYADCVVFDAFAQSHRECPSITGILSLLPSVCGLSMLQEYKTLTSLLAKPKYPFVVVMGGAKISDKVEALEHLLGIADIILIGGAMAHNFLKAEGVKISASLIEDPPIDSKKRQQHMYSVAEHILAKAKGIFVNLGHNQSIPKLVLPIDLVAASKAQDLAQTEIVDLTGDHPLPWNWMYLDIGPNTANYYSSIIKKAKTIFWNGPMGYSELQQFSTGTKAIAESIAANKGTTIIGGGDTEIVIKSLGLHKKYSFVSTGGGASLYVLAGKELPVLPYLKKS
ncbi:MAG: phosphoglycerate kinase [Patescibacteria group bacterium]